ncbi:MAG: hypothetical protein IJ549_01860 [Prevotella sp.]|nr:hypothetical protein [Prevotella sp.]MBQ8701493.1 hypothetical protein [Prevotella sp.]
MKRYIKPNTDVQAVVLQQMIATSLPKGGDPITDPLSKKGEYILDDVDLFGTKKDKWADEEEEE